MRLDGERGNGEGGEDGEGGNGKGENGGRGGEGEMGRRRGNEEGRFHRWICWQSLGGHRL